MAVMLLLVLVFLITGSNSKETNSSKVEVSKKQDGSPSSVDSRFFDLGGIIHQLLPGFNQGHQGGPGRNPAGMDSPANSQFYPGSIQGPNSQTPTGPGTWPVIDDAKQYPNQGNFGGYPENPNTGNINRPQGPPYQQYPSQGNYGGGLQNQYPPTPQYPSQGNPPYPNMNGSPTQFPQYPNQGGYGQPPNPEYPPDQAGYDRPPMETPQYPNQGYGRPPINPDYPSQGNYPENPVSNPGYGGTMPPYSGNPTVNGPGYPDQNGGSNPMENNFGNYGPGAGGDGTLDGLVPPGNGWNPSSPDEFPTDQFNASDPVEQPGSGTNAILGNPVVVQPSTTEQGQIIYPSSTESPARRQCVQDCETTSEYNPICGSDNVTYINPGKFVCARNCGINVFVSRRGRCPSDVPQFAFPRPDMGKFAENVPT